MSNLRIGYFTSQPFPSSAHGKEGCRRAQDGHGATEFCVPYEVIRSIQGEMDMQQGLCLHVK